MTGRRQPAPPPFQRAELLKRGPSLFQPDVWKVWPEGAEPTVWKTFRDRPAWARTTVCRFITRREAGNLRALRGLDGVPQFLGQPDPWTVEMTWLEGAVLPNDKRGHALDEAFFDDLSALVAEIHARGLNHGDLRRKNVMRDPQSNAPVLIDFAQSMNARRPFAVFSRLFFATARRVDAVRIIRLKKWYLGEEQLADEERRLFRHPPWYMRLGRGFRRGLYRPLKHWSRARRGRVQ